MHRAKCYLTSAFALAMISAPVAAQNFEGVMKFVVRKAEGEVPDSLTQFTKGAKMRIEKPQEPGALVSDGSKWFTLFPSAKRYVIVPAIDAANAGPEMGRKNGTAVKTGKSEVIAGITCEVWHFTGTGEDEKPESGDACLAKGAGFMVGRMTVNNMGRHFNTAGLAYEKARASGMGVMKVTTNGTVVLETIKAHAQPEADALFSVPADYKATTMREIFKMKP